MFSLAYRAFLLLRMYSMSICQGFSLLIFVKNGEADRRFEAAPPFDGTEAHSDESANRHYACLGSRLKGRAMFWVVPLRV